MHPSRLRAAAPAIAALLAAAVVVVVVVVAQPGERTGPLPPGPVRPAPVSLDLGEQSLDRCALALAATGLTGNYPDRAEWLRLAVLFTGDTFVTLLDAEVPFVCVAGPRTVEVSDPAAAVPVGSARLLLTSEDGVLAAVAAGPDTVLVTGAAAAAGGVGARHFLGLTGTSITRPDQLTVTVDGPAVAVPSGPPDRLAPPALHLVDRPWESADRITATDDLLDRCLAARTGEELPLRWQTAHVVSYRDRDRAAALLVAISVGTVGGCTVGPDGVTPLKIWHRGQVRDGSRPFSWLPRPGETLPDLGADVAAGPVAPGVARLEVTAGTGRRWHASVAGGTFATQIPDGVAPDARELTVRVYDAEDRLIYDGPAVG